MPGRASAGNTSRRCEPLRLSLACSGSSEASRRFLKCQIGARSSNIPFFDLLAGCTPPPVNDSSEAATLSAGRIPRSLGTIVGWSRATTVQAVECLRSSMYLRACSKRTSTGGSNETSPTSSKMSAQIAPGLLSDQAESKPKMIVSVCRVVTLGAKLSSSVGRSENRPILRQAGCDREYPYIVGNRRGPGPRPRFWPRQPRRYLPTKRAGARWFFGTTPGTHLVSRRFGRIMRLKGDTDLPGGVEISQYRRFSRVGLVAPWT